MIDIRDRPLREGPARAPSSIREFDDIFALLSASPLVGRSGDGIRIGLRSISHGQYVVFYRLFVPDIEIVRVVPGRRDLTRIVES